MESGNYTSETLHVYDENGITRSLYSIYWVELGEKEIFHYARKCCMNCEYFWGDVFLNCCYCTIDKEPVPEPLEQIKFCLAFKLWWGAVE